MLTFIEVINYHTWIGPMARQKTNIPPKKEPGRITDWHPKKYLGHPRHLLGLIADLAYSRGDEELADFAEWLEPYMNCERSFWLLGDNWV